MNTISFPLFRNALLASLALSVLGSVCWISTSAVAQEESKQSADIRTLAQDGGGILVVDTRGKIPEPTVFYTARAEATVQVGLERLEQTISLEIEVIQGKAKVVSLGLNGDDDVVDVQGEELRSWAVRRVGAQRFLDLQVKEDVTNMRVSVKTRSPRLALPAEIDVTHLSPGKSVGFNSTVSISYGQGVEGKVVAASGFAPLQTYLSDGGARATRFQSATGGQLKLALTRDSASAGPVELLDTTLNGTLHANGKSMQFQLRAVAQVTEPHVSVTIIKGNAALSEIPASENYRLRLSTDDGQPVYSLEFTEEGTFPIAIDFVASLSSPGTDGQGLEFAIAASAVVPLRLDGLDPNLEFEREQGSIVPIREADSWLGFLPATGRTKLQWKAARKAGKGKLFFTTSGLVDTQVSAGLMRQDHRIDYQVLQGELKALSIDLRGPGEVLDVQGTNLVGWKVIGDGEERQLDVTLSQAITGTSQLRVRSQTPLGAFPIRVDGLRLNPLGAVRHSGFLRLSNSGSVRLEPTSLSGLTQLSPDQFPGEATEARQVFVYRFPAAEHTFTIAADRIQPEINISQLVLYELDETDRKINADIELDVREAPIREWDFSIPSDYSVVAVTGSSVADYVAASEVTNGRRNLKVIFGQDVAGRQLVRFHLEKSEVASASEWVLPRIEYAGAKMVRGDIGIVGAPGFRITATQTDLLVEKPLSYFPKATPNLQQAFRIRESDWSATMRIELLDRSVQSDVFHLYSLSEETVYGSALINYFITGSPVSEWKITTPESLKNIMVDGQDVRTWRREGETLIVSLHQPVMGAYTLLVTFEEKPDKANGSFQAGLIAPNDVQGERGYIQVVSPMQVEINTASISEEMLKLDPLELPAELRLLSSAPPLGTWQYTERPFDLYLNVKWFQPGNMVAQVVEFSEANSRVSQDGELVTDVTYFVKSRGQRTLKIQLPSEPVRLWEVAVNGQPVTARQSENATLIPLPGGTDPNIPVEVSLRLGKPAVDAAKPVLMLPIVFAPVLKTQWNVTGDEQHVLVPSGGSVEPPVPVLRPSGLDWLAKQGLIALAFIVLFTLIGVWSCTQNALLRFIGLLSLALAIGLSLSTASTALSQTAAPHPLQLSLPILSAGEVIELQVTYLPIWLVNLSWIGLAILLVGIATLAWSFTKGRNAQSLSMMPALPRCGGALLIAVGVLLQGDGAPWFYALLAFSILILLFLPPAIDLVRSVSHTLRGVAGRRRKSKEKAEEKPNEGVGPATASIMIFLALTFSSAGPGLGAVPDGFEAADSISQEWSVTQRDARLIATGTITLTGRPGDRFLLLKSPAVLTQFEGEGLRLTKSEVPDEGLVYMISISAPEPMPEANHQDAEEGARVDEAQDVAGGDDPSGFRAEPRSYQATFEFQLQALNPMEGMPVLTGLAAVQNIDLRYDEAGWDVFSPTAVRIESVGGDDVTQAKVLLGPGDATLFLRPRMRDVTSETTQFFVEASNLYLPGPGVVDGRHRLHIRTSQGQVTALVVLVPTGLTVSAVSGPVGSWQFDADSGGLKLEIEPAQSQAFDVVIETQRGLTPLPADISLAPLKVEGAGGEVGLMAIAFGPEAQPEKSDAKQMSAVNLGDFDASLMLNKQAVLHRVYRYGADGGELEVRVAPVEPEVRMVSQQVLSLGDERVVLGINFNAEITRAGLFQLSFPLPAGLEVESLTGAALHHWAELTDGDERQIILHLSGKTIGAHSFALTLTGAAPTDIGEWEIPRFELREAVRHTADLIVRPTTGIRLRTVSRQNVSEADPRGLGGAAQGSLAFRLLQRDWNLVLGIEKLDPWVTGQVLHEITLREGQTRSAIIANFDVQNAAIRALQVLLPISDEGEIKTLRASGSIVSDFVRTAPDSNIWEVQFKRRVVGKIDFRIEYERRGDRANERESLNPAEFPQSRQLAYFFAVRAGGRLELEHDTLSNGWQQIDWSTVPASLREAENRNAPVFALRAVAPAGVFMVQAKRHSLADALKLRVAQGSLTTILSPTGDQLTAVDMTIEVIQRSSLSVGLPEGGALFSIFVNGESVNSIRQGDDTNAWQFSILPGIDDRTANVRFVYSATGDRLSKLKLTSPELNVPLENIQWSVIAPEGFELIDDEGNLELTSQTKQAAYDRDSYLSQLSGKRKFQAQQATQLLQQANQLLQAGEQTKARWALNSVANQYALDAASNEDARIQLENLQTQQAIVGLNTRRQRFFLDNSREDSSVAENTQLREAAADNPILQQEQLNFRPQQLSQLLRGNTTEDNAILGKIAARLVRHQRTSQPAPQAIIISLPEEGQVYTFSRSVQVAENAPLELDLAFGLQRQLQPWQTVLSIAFLAALAAAFTLVKTGSRRNKVQGDATTTE